MVAAECDDHATRFESPGLRVPAYVERVVENVTRFASGVEPVAVIDVSAGY